MQVIQKIKQFLLRRSLISGSSDPGSGNRLRCSRSTYIKNQRNIRIIGSVSLVLLFALTVFTLRPVSVSTDFAEATANPATTTLTVATSGNAAILDITPSSTTGTFSSSDTTDTSLEFSVTTDNITGYNLSIRHASATSPAPLTSEDLTEDLDSLPTGTSITESQFNSTEYVGHYGYKPSMLNSADNSNYIPAPTTNSTTLNKTTRANTTSDEYTIALGANIDYTKSAGTYTNTFILTAVANDVPYTINYLDNTGTGGATGTDVSNLPSSEASSTATAVSSFILSSTIPTRIGYTFAGWCDGTVTHNATGNDTCSGTTYPAGSAYSFANPSSTSTNVANLYAMWNVKTFAITLAKTNATAIVIDGTSYTGSSATLTYGPHTIGGTYPSGYEFSSWATSNATNLSISSTTSASTTITVHGAATLTLTGKTITDYCITNNIADSNCMQKMVPSNCTSTVKTVYDARDGSVYKVQRLADDKCWLLDNLRLGSADFASGVTELNSTNTNTTNFIATSTFAGWNTTSGFNSYDTPMINTASANDTTGWGSTSRMIGVYYNYCAATMQSYCYASGSGTGDASEDVCPKGWRMPTGGSSGEYQALYTAYSSNASNFRNALSTPFSGYFWGSSTEYKYSGGYFWSSTYYDSNFMYLLYDDGSYVYPQSYGGRNNGFSVRCVLKEPIESVTYMQDVTSEMVANTTEGATATLRDIRDNQYYTVAKINGNLWMTRNLAIGCNGDNISSKSLTNADSNVANTSSNPWNTPTTSLTSGNSYDDPRMTCSSTYGAWYNYAAASAGTITGSSNSTAASKDICPAGWRLPTYSEQSGITGYSSAFSPVTGGGYIHGSTDGTDYAGWWSATAGSSTYRYNLKWHDSSLYTDLGDRNYGFYVRCIRSS